jgi:hypothetical protein
MATARPIVLFRNGTWYVRSSASGQTTQRTLGKAGDQPVLGDFDGDDVPTWPFSATARLIQTHSTNGADCDHLVVCRATVASNRDGKADLCVYRDGSAVQVLVRLHCWTATQWVSAATFLVGRSVRLQRRHLRESRRDRAPDGSGAPVCDDPKCL